MTQLRFNPKSTQFILGGLLTSVALIPMTASIATAQLNPCPGIYYSEPFNSIAASPQGCPPNAAAQRRLTQQEAQSPGALTGRTIPFEGATPVQPPLPENRADPVANIALNGTYFDVELVNNTNALVTTKSSPKPIAATYPLEHRSHYEMFPHQLLSPLLDRMMDLSK
jgi:hypothetical protein